jgi:Bacteriocin-protection, YdeI or OmpD-Associated
MVRAGAARAKLASTAQDGGHGSFEDVHGGVLDISAALDAEPDAGASFDSLAQFYRKGYLRWTDGTKGRPELRAARIGGTTGARSDACDG